MGKRRGRGEGGFEQLPSGKWRATRVRHGQRERKTFLTKRLAMDWLHEAIKAARGEWADRTLEAWMIHWLAEKKTSTEPATLAWYSKHYDLRIKPHIGQLKLGELTAMHVRSWMTKLADELNCSARIRHQALKTLRGALAEAVRLEQISRNPALSVKLPKLKQTPMLCLDASQAVKLLATAQQDRFGPLFDLAIDSGMRPGELFALHWPNVNLKEGWVYVCQSLENISGRIRLKEVKTDAGRRRVPICQRTIDSLTSHKRKMDREKQDTTFGAVFVSDRGSLLYQSDFNKLFRKLVTKAELPPIRLYDLRHTSATLLLAADVNIKVVSERLGHTDIAITLRHYAHALPSMQQKAVEAMQQILSDQPTGSPLSS